MARHGHPFLECPPLLCWAILPLPTKQFLGRHGADIFVKTNSPSLPLVALRLNACKNETDEIQFLSWFDGMFQQRQPAPGEFPAHKASTLRNTKEQKWGTYRDSVLNKLDLNHNESALSKAFQRACMLKTPTLPMNSKVRIDVSLNTLLSFLEEAKIHNPHGNRLLQMSLIWLFGGQQDSANINCLNALFIWEASKSFMHRLKDG